MGSYIIHLSNGQVREVEAGAVGREDGWWLFFKFPPEGGKQEACRYNMNFVISIERRGG